MPSFMSPLFLPRKFFVWLFLLMMHSACGAVFLLLWLNHQDQGGVMTIWIFEAVMIAAILVRMVIHVCNHILKTPQSRKVEHHSRHLIVFCVIVDMTTSIVILLQIVPDNTKLEVHDSHYQLASLVEDFTAINIPNPAIVIFIMLINTWVTAIIEVLLFTNDESPRNGNEEDDTYWSWDARWLNRPLVRPSPTRQRVTSTPAHGLRGTLPEDFSARIVAVQHGSPPEMWRHSKRDRLRHHAPAPPPVVRPVPLEPARLLQREPVRPLPLQPMRPLPQQPMGSQPLQPVRYDPIAARRPRTPPPIITTWNQWYVTPGEAI